MPTFDITFQVCDYPDNPKRLTAAIVSPSQPGPATGGMLFTHGWGGNRFRVLDLMQYAADTFDVVCISVEYRQSGYDFDPVGGDGWDRPQLIIQLDEPVKDLADHRRGCGVRPPPGRGWADPPPGRLGMFRPDALERPERP